MSTDMKTALLNKIEAREAQIAIIGIGYVGLPLAVEFAKEGYRVFGVDVSADKVERINRGVSRGRCPQPPTSASCRRSTRSASACRRRCARPKTPT
jgi:UDP-N-acetyl-D-mannosaminuronate dehydrogenase